MIHPPIHGAPTYLLRLPKGIPSEAINRPSGITSESIARKTYQRTGVYTPDQCAPSSALKLVTPESNDPVIAAVAGTPRGKPTFINEAMKIAAIGRAITK